MAKSSQNMKKSGINPGLFFVCSLTSPTIAAAIRIKLIAAHFTVRFLHEVLELILKAGVAGWSEDFSVDRRALPIGRTGMICERPFHCGRIGRIGARCRP